MGKQSIKTDYNYEQLCGFWQIDINQCGLIYKVINNEIDLGKFESVIKLRKQCHNPPNQLDEQMEALNELIEGYGIESSTMEGYYKSHYWSDCIGIYVNQGDSYNLTIIYDVVNDRFEFMTWGDWIESIEQQLIDDGSIDAPDRN